METLLVACARPLPSLLCTAVILVRRRTEQKAAVQMFGRTWRVLVECHVCVVLLLNLICIEMSRLQNRKKNFIDPTLDEFKAMFSFSLVPVAFIHTCIWLILMTMRPRGQIPLKKVQCLYLLIQPGSVNTWYLQGQRCCMWEIDTIDTDNLKIKFSGFYMSVLDLQRWDLT